MKSKRARLLILIGIFLAYSAIAQAQDEIGDAYLPHFISTAQNITTLALDASAFTGESSTSVPIELPPAAGNIQKKLSLALRYRSGNSANSWTGKGWELEPGYIIRLNRFGANSPDNPYLLILNGETYELVRVQDNDYRTKIETNMRVRKEDETMWNVWSKDGTKYKFERFWKEKWLLKEIWDARGVGINISYARYNDQELYLDEINYPVGAGLTPYCRINFSDEERQDKILSSYYGQVIKMNKLLRDIEIFADGAMQKRYKLEYATNGTTNIQMLQRVIEYGKDTSSLPPTVFSYLPYESKGRDTFQGARELANFSGRYKTDAADAVPGGAGTIPMAVNTAVIDMTADGLPDLFACKWTGKAVDWVVYRNTGSGFSSEEVWLSAGSSGFGPYYSLSRDVTLADMNKDGLPDLVYTVYDGSRSFNMFVRYNTGSNFSGSPVKILDGSEAQYAGLGITYNIRIGYTVILADMNGDGLPDIVYNKPREWQSGQGVCDWIVRLNTGSGFSDQEQVWLNYQDAYFKYELTLGDGRRSGELEHILISQNSLLTDMNGDGLLDLVYNEFVSSGREYSVDGSNHTAQYDIKVRYNTGSRFSEQPVTYFPIPDYTHNASAKKDAVSVKVGTTATVADMNNDGLPDLVYNSYESGPTVNNRIYPNLKWYAALNMGNKFNRPILISGPRNYSMQEGSTYYVNVAIHNSYVMDINTDGALDLVYPQFTGWDSGSVQFKLMACLNTQEAVFTDLLNSQTSPYGGRVEIIYESSSKFNNKGSDDKSDLPFALAVVKSVTKNPGIGEAGTTTYNYEGGWYDMPGREFRGFRHIATTDPLGYVSHAYFHQDDSRLGKVEREENSITRAVYKYRDDTSPPYYTPLIEAEECIDSKCEKTVYDYDNYGNVIKANYHGDTSVSGDEKSALTDYPVNESAWIVGLPGRERIFSSLDGGGALAGEAQYLYDNNSNYTDLPQRGNLTAAKRYLNTKGIYIQAGSTYDTYGNEITSTDANGRTTAIEYDASYHAFPVAVINPKGHIGRSYYYAGSEAGGLFGELKSKTDPNGNTTTFEYDGFGRKKKITGPLDIGSTYGSESYEYSVSSTPGSSYVLTRTTEEYGTASHLIKIDLLDGFERVIQSAKESEAEGTYTYITTGYNKRGEVERVSLPYFGAGLPSSYAAPPGSVRWAQNSYDAIGRLTRIAKPDGGSISNSYNGWTTIVTDENGHPKTLVKDAYDRLAAVIENNLGESYTTSYRYDALDNLTGITDHAGNNFGFLYDTLGRRVSMADPDLGAWSYDYDNNGSLTQSINANSQTINYGYDELSRLRTKDYTHAPGIEVTYNYDEPTSANAIGRRSSMQDLSGRSRWDYDKEGRIVKLEKTIDIDTYIVEWAYDAMDRVKAIILPNKKQLSFRYNNAGLPEGVDGYINSSEYNAAGQPTAILFANPVTQRLDYYPENNRLKSITSGSLQDLRYSYDLVGNVTQINDAVHSYTKNYGYDGLDRLLNGDSYSYSYNPIGNLTTVNGIAQGYTVSRPHALTNDGANSYSYDSCGNMTSGAGRTISYDAENRPLRITKGAAVTTFTYDGDGRRVKKSVSKSNPPSTTIYIEGLYEKETNPAKSPGFKHKFTGKELDDDTGLYDYGARMYDAKLSRFITADPLQWTEEEIKEKADKSLQEFLANPQNLNRYSYALNNPLRYTDPTGEIVIEAITTVAVYMIKAGVRSGVQAGIGTAMVSLSAAVIRGEREPRALVRVGTLGFARGFTSGFIAGALKSVGVPQPVARTAAGAVTGTIFQNPVGGLAGGVASGFSGLNNAFLASTVGTTVGEVFTPEPAYGKNNKAVNQTIQKPIQQPNLSTNQQISNNLKINITDISKQQKETKRW